MCVAVCALSLSHARIHLRTRTNTRTHTHAHTNTHTYIHTKTQAHAQTHTHTRTRTHAHSHTHTHTHTNTSKHTNTLKTFVRAQVYEHTVMTCLYSCILNGALQQSTTHYRHCSTLRHITAHYNTMHYSALNRSTLRHTAYADSHTSQNIKCKPSERTLFCASIRHDKASMTTHEPTLHTRHAPVLPMCLLSLHQIQSAAEPCQDGDGRRVQGGNKSSDTS